MDASLPLSPHARGVRLAVRITPRAARNAIEGVAIDAAGRPELRIRLTAAPVDGSANVALIGLLAKLRPEPDLELSKKIAQGVEMGRPSLLHAEAEKRGGVVTATYIGGRCVPVMQGSIDLA